MDTNATTDDDVKAIKKLGEEFFAGVNAEDLDRRMATMDPDVVIMPPGRPSIFGKEEIRRLSHEYAETYEENAAWFTMRLKQQDIGALLEPLSTPSEHLSRAAGLKS
jgi:ketosteroid isomerase-like protein